MIKTKGVKIAAPVLLFFCYQWMPDVKEFLSISFRFLREYDFYGLRGFLLSYGAAAPLVSILLMVFQSVVPFVPGVVMTITNAWLFGWLQGSLYSGIGALLGAVVDFYIARWYGKTCFERMAGERYVRLLHSQTEKHGAFAVFIARLLPIIPFKAVSYSAGLSRLDVRAFAFFTFIGQMPAILLYSVLGENIQKNMLLIFILTACFCVITAFLLRQKKRWC